MDANELEARFDDMIGEVRNVWSDGLNVGENEVIDYFEVLFSQLIEAMRVGEASVLEANHKKTTWHNHFTRDIKPEGSCPGCDLYYKAMREKGEQ